MRKTTRRRFGPFWLQVSALLLLLSAFSVAEVAASPREASAADIREDGYTSAQVCGQCHADIYRSWKKSLHAFSLTDPIFDAAFMQAVRDSGDDARRLCLSCHAPMTTVNDDLELAQGVTREGVSCDFCHTVTAVHLDAAVHARYTSEPGLVKRSVIKETSSPAHEVAYSELHGTSEICGGCHNYVTPEGTAIMSTYDEWRHGPYAREGVQCQSCHMALGEGRVVRSDIRDTGHRMHLHSLIHDRTQLESAVDVRIVHAERTERGVRVEVEIENSGSGHKVPTGMPTREIVLRVDMDDGRDTATRDRRYRKVVGDEQRRPLSQDYEIFLRGAKILSDNRLAPREKRREVFVFPTRGSSKVKVSATVSYVYRPMALKQEHLEVRLSEAETTIH